MRWLWYVGPIVVAVVYALVAFWPTRRAQRRTAELKRWVEEFLGPLTPARKKSKKKRSARDLARLTRSRFLGRLPRAFDDLLEAAGPGSSVANIVLVPKLAYLAMRGANRVSSTDHQTVVARLAKPAPSMVVRPLPVVEGRQVDNRGVQFDRDPDFMQQYLVEGVESRAIVKWLRKPIREALVELPDVWLRTEGRVMALTLYGEVSAERLDEFVATADAVFAERGAGGAPSLFGDEDHAPAPSRETEPETKPAKSAAARARLGALAVDALLYVLAAVVLIVVLALREGGWETVSVSSVLGPGPSDPLDGAWQGGWNTKGFGALVAAEAFLAVLFVYQTYLAARAGESIGKRLFGARIVSLAGDRVHFLRGVLIRTWAIAAVPLAVAALLTRPLGVRAYLATLFDWRVMAVAFGAIALDAVVMLIGSKRRALHDYIAGTQVISAPGGWRRLLDL